jgi:predicted nucleic acid-binding protein
MAIEFNKGILLDTNCFIYYFEDNENYADKLEIIFDNIQKGKNKAYMSVLSILEILVKPKKENNIFLENRYKLMLSNYPNLSILDVTVNIADIAARLRAKYSIKTPDAIILATALRINADYIITCDIKLKGICEQEGIGIIDLNNK